MGFISGQNGGPTQLFDRFDGVVDAHGQPLVSGGALAEPGLYFCGYNVTAGGMLREIRHEARDICALISRPEPAVQA